MPSILPGFSYDIFISYRQKDNKYDGWVTEFVENLKKELAATFKEDVSIYFDINPQDGLLESYDVADSLKVKLKCLIFIPVISQTYCDPKSFAWEHEFKDFIQIASNDQFGLKIKLPNGNIGSRVLPVRIHDLKPEDIELFESVLGATLRGIEFIYKSLGVNRPLRANEDHAQDNLNKTYYRDQINKTAHALNDTISALKSGLSGIPDEPGVKIQSSVVHDLKEKRQKPVRIPRPIKFGILAIAFILLAVFSFHWMITSKKLTSEEILDRVINYYDFYRTWDDYRGTIHIASSFSDGDYVEDIIEIRTRENYYKIIRYNGLDTVARGIKDGKFFLEINGNTNPDEDLIKKFAIDSVSIGLFRDHHYWQFGGVMFLKSSGLDLEKKVGRTKFHGYNCFTITFSSDSNKVKTSYFKSTKWDIYVNRDNFSIVGYRVDGMFETKENYLTCQGEIENNDIKMPMIKIYYNGLNNSLFLVDVLHKIK